VHPVGLGLHDALHIEYPLPLLHREAVVGAVLAVDACAEPLNWHYFVRIPLQKNFADRKEALLLLVKLVGIWVNLVERILETWIPVAASEVDGHNQVHL